MADHFHERSRLGSPLSKQSGRAREWESYMMDQCVPPPRLSPPQKRRRRLQRQAVREAAVHTNRLVSLAPFLKSNLNASECPEKTTVGAALGGIGQTLARLESLISDVHSACFCYGSPADGQNFGMSGDAEVLLDCLNPLESNSSLRAKAPEFIPPPQVFEDIRVPQFCLQASQLECVGCWEPLIFSPYCSAAHVCRHCFFCGKRKENMQARVNVESGQLYDNISNDSESAATAEQAVGMTETWVYAEPKRPPSAYFIYTNDAKNQAAGKLDSAAIRNIQEGWNQLDSARRQGYEIEAARLKTLYEEQRADYSAHGRYKLRVQMTSSASPSAASKPASDGDVPDSSYEQPQSDADDQNEPEFSHAQLHHIIDYTVGEFSDNIVAKYPDKLFLQSAPFDSVAQSFKKGLPNVDQFTDGEAIFSKAQITALISAINESCIELALKGHKNDERT